MQNSCPVVSGFPPLEKRSLGLMINVKQAPFAPGHLHFIKFIILICMAQCLATSLLWFTPFHPFPPSVNSHGPHYQGQQRSQRQRSQFAVNFKLTFTLPTSTILQRTRTNNHPKQYRTNSNPTNNNPTLNKQQKQHNLQHHRSPHFTPISW